MEVKGGWEKEGIEGEGVEKGRKECKWKESMEVGGEGKGRKRCKWVS